MHPRFCCCCLASEAFEEGHSADHASLLFRDAYCDQRRLYNIEISDEIFFSDDKARVISERRNHPSFVCISPAALNYT